jgi:Coenzyme PQQ synthesis protein D (PqqD)
MTHITNNTLVAVAEDVVSCDLLEETAILNMKNSVYYGLDPVGTRIWNLIQQPITIQEILDVLLAEYDVEPERCQADLYELIEQLIDNQLVEIK